MIKVDLKESPREFTVGDFTILDHGSVTLSTVNSRTNSMVTVCTAEGKRCDIAATNWGLYLGPSLNSRLKNEGFKTALVHNNSGQLYLMAVDKDKLNEFEEYRRSSSLTVVSWLDNWTPPS